MPQIKRGTVSIEQGTNLVIGDADVDWSTVVEGTSLFSLQGSGQTLFLIQTTTPPETSASGFWELTLADAGAGNTYTGPDVTEALHYIHKDWEPTYGFPLFAPGDFVDQVWNRFVLHLASILGITGGGGSGLQLLTTIDIATVALPKPSLYAKISIQDSQFVLQWWLLQTGAPVSDQDYATIDDPSARWSQVG